MSPDQREDIIIVGCGRVGQELAQSINRQGHNVAVMDWNPRAFERLPADFRGRTVVGDPLDYEALRRAGIESAHGLAAVTPSDSTNIVVARIARDLFKVEHVVARVYEPTREPIYEMLGLPAVSSTAWGAQRMEQLLLHPGLESVYVAGKGEVQVYQASVPESWKDRPLGELLPPETTRAVGLTRAGHAVLPGADLVLQPLDVLLVSATGEGAAELRQRLQANGKA